MSTVRRVVEVDRVVVHGLDLDRARAARIRQLIERELSRQWDQSGDLEGLGGDVSRVEVTSPELGVDQSDGRLAAGLGRSITRALSRRR